jgi:hypothetical protein
MAVNVNATVAISMSVTHLRASLPAPNINADATNIVNVTGAGTVVIMPCAELAFKSIVPRSSVSPKAALFIRLRVLRALRGKSPAAHHSRVAKSAIERLYTIR